MKISDVRKSLPQLVQKNEITRIEVHDEPVAVIVPIAMFEEMVRAATRQDVPNLLAAANRPAAEIALPRRIANFDNAVAAKVLRDAFPTRKRGG